MYLKLKDLNGSEINRPMFSTGLHFVETYRKIIIMKISLFNLPKAMQVINPTVECIADSCLHYIFKSRIQNIP